MSTNRNVPQTIAVTGALGNLGTKLLHHLARCEFSQRLIALDLQTPTTDQAASLHAAAKERTLPPAIDFVQCDLSNWHDRRWRDALEQSDAVVHFAAQNPYPEATWADAAASIDMTLHIANAAADSAQLRRMVFATSNHVMGRYKDSPLADTIGPHELHVDLPQGVGTIWHTGEAAMDSTPYATSKMAGERICRSLGARTQGQTSFACVRIGWCQPGENLPTTLSAAGTPTQQTGDVPADVDAKAYARADRWFKEMWLSNRDFLQLFERAITADSHEWPDGFILVNGMSNNTNMKWNLDATKRWLAYEPQDNVVVVKRELIWSGCSNE